MSTYNPAFKGWASCMDGFISEETKEGKQDANFSFTPECEGPVEILWSSSSDEENVQTKSKRKKVVTRLNFDECINHSSGPMTPTYSRYLEDVEATDGEKNYKQSDIKEMYDSYDTPREDNSLLQADIHIPSSPVILRRKRRRSLNDGPTSPVIERKFMKKSRKLTPEVVNSPINLIGNYRLERNFSPNSSMSCSSIDMVTPRKLDDNCQPTNITPVLEGMHLNSTKSKRVVATDDQQLIMTSPPSPIIEVASSQDILETTRSDDFDQIKEESNSQADAHCGLESDGLPLSANITLSASPVHGTDSVQESGGGDGLNPGFAMLPFAVETPNKNAFVPMEDPESGGKRKRLKKGGLAVRLQRLLNREHSWKRIWQHEKLGKSHSSTGCLILRVKSIWTEVSKILAQCQVESKPKLSKGQFIADHVILLLDPTTVGEKGIRPDCIIRIYPPWQSLLISGHATVLLCANLLEVVPPVERQHYVEVLEKEVVTKMYSCQCIDGGHCVKFDKACTFRLELGGKEFLSKIMPSLVKDASEVEEKENSTEPQLLLTQLPADTLDDTRDFGGEQKKQGTISEVVAAHSQKDGSIVCGSPLIARIQRVFCYRASQQASVLVKRSLSLARNSTKRWSVLLQDAVGEFCEVEFESQPEVLSLDQPDGRGEGFCEGPWWGITYAGALLHEGAILSISSLRILKRSEGNKPRGLTTVISAVQKEMKHQSEEEGLLNSWHERITNGQLFVYSFAYQKGGSLEKLEEGRVQLPPWSQPLITTLYNALHEWKQKDPLLASNEGERVTVLVKLLFVLPSTRGSPHRLFVSDPSLSALSNTREIPPLWMQVSLKPFCCVPPLLSGTVFNPFCSSSGLVLYLQDLEWYGGELTCDRFSRVHLDGGIGSLPTWVGAHSDLIAFTRSSPLPRVPPLQPNAMPGEVVSITGNIVGVDEETAYSWPACKFCGNDQMNKEQIPGTSDQRSVYYCYQCKSSVDKPINKMSLNVYIACHSLSTECCRVKVKLGQKSIMELLPCSEEQIGYEIASVLGKLIGPLFCVLISTCKNFQVRQKEDTVFVLEELLCFVNMQG